MPTPSTAAGFSAAEFAAALLAQKELNPRASLIAEQTLQILPPDTAVVVYVVPDQENPSWQQKAVAGEIAHQAEEFEIDAGTLGVLAERREALVFSAADLAREDYAHLNVVRTVQVLAYVPIAIEQLLLGAIEIISYGPPISEHHLELAGEIAEYSALAIATALTYENERNTQLQSISRLTELYDIQTVFHDELEMDDLLAIISSKVQEITRTQACNVWLVTDEELLLVQQCGIDPTIEVGATLKAGDKLAMEVSDSGEPLLISDAADVRLAARNEGVEEGAIVSYMAVPMFVKEELVGVIEVINREDAEPFDEDDAFLLNTVGRAAAGSLKNASLLLAERKVEILETLVKVSREITSTLNLERVLQAVVNGPGEVIPYERASIALERSGKLQVRAISGVTQINPGDPDVVRLSDLLLWAETLGPEIYVTEHDGEIDEPREETRAKFKKYFEESGAKGFYAIPLADDEGRVGILSFESSDPDFLGPAHFEMIKVLAGQVTVAVRNADLYREVPFIGVLEPLLEKKRKFMSLEQRKRKASLVLAVAVVLLLVLLPIKMRVDGEATVAARRTAKIQPEVEGTIRRVLVREGEAVKQGTVLAEMDDWDYRAQLADAQAKYAGAEASMNRALAANDGTEAGIQQVQADYWRSETTRAAERLERTKLRSPIDGLVATPHIEDFVGRKLEIGDVFGEVVDSSHATVDVAIPEDDVALLQPGSAAAVKLDSYPTRTFRGEVMVVSPASVVQADQRVFFARVDVPNPDGAIRAGMQGRGKVSAGWHSAGYVLFRRPAMWAWGKLWSWFGW